MPKAPSAAFIPSLQLEVTSDVPKHRQIYRGYRDAILSRQILEGTQLPSTRELAEHFGVSRNTVVNAFEQLLAEGFLTGRVGSGTFVSTGVSGNWREAGAPKSAAPELAAGSVRLSRTAESLTTAYAWEPEKNIGPFRLSNPAVDLFPWSTWARISNRCLQQFTREQASYMRVWGIPQCREAIAGYLRNSRNVRCEKEQVFITSGSQQGITLSAKVVVNEGESVWMEDPGYPGAKNALLLNGIRISPVPVDEEGLSVTAGRQLAPDAAGAYVTPSHQYPLGMYMSLKRRLELLDWARENGTWILEDDYDSEFRYGGPPLSSLQGLSEADRVIYIGTFSKVLFPSFRLGYVVVPPALVDAFAAVRYALDEFPPTLPQLVVTDFITEGHFARHIRRMRSLYGERLTHLAQCIEDQFGDLGQLAHVPRSGLHLALILPEECDDRAICRVAAKRGIILEPLSPLYLRMPARRGLLLGVGSVPKTQIGPALDTLKEILGSHTCSNLVPSECV